MEARGHMFGIACEIELGRRERGKEKSGRGNWLTDEQQRMLWASSEQVDKGREVTAGDYS